MHSIWRCLIPILLCAACDRESSTPDPPMDAPNPIGGFVKLADHGSQFHIVRSDHEGPIVGWSAKKATWWTRGTSVTASIPPFGDDGGAQWLEGGTLGIGIGILDPATKSFTQESGLKTYATPYFGGSRLLGETVGPNYRSLESVAWLPGGARVALLFSKADPPSRCCASAADATYPTDPEHVLAIVQRTNANNPVVRTIEIVGTASLAAADDRVIVWREDTRLFDVSGNLIAGPNRLPRATRTVSVGAGVFLIVGTRVITVVDPHDGATLARWELPDLVDAVPIRHGVVALTGRGVVQVGCFAGHAVTPVAQTTVDSRLTQVQVTGERLVVVGDDVLTAHFTNPCP